MITKWTQAQNRAARSARALKAYFESKLETRLEILTEPPATTSEGDMPFSDIPSDYGLWGLRPAKPLRPEDQEEISKTFATILGSMERMEQTRGDLERLEAKLEATREELPSNVIPLRRRPTTESGFSSITDKRWILKLDCLIESTNPEDIHKMAMELHSHSARYAFLEYGELDPVTRLQIPELLQMGAVSLFIPNILELNLAEQDVLLQMIQQDTLNRPLLMVGATIPYSELRGTPNLNLEFLACLSRAYIKLSRPFSEYKDQGLIHYFLDSLSHNPT